MRLCEFCGEEAVDGILERGGSGFVGQRYIQANDNQYLVEYRCRECGMVQGLAIEDIEPDESLSEVEANCDHEWITKIVNLEGYIRGNQNPRTRRYCKKCGANGNG